MAAHGAPNTPEGSSAGAEDRGAEALPYTALKRSIVQHVLYIALAITASWIFSGALVIYNKWLFQGFPFPLLVTFSHMVVIFAVLVVCVHALHIVERPNLDRHTYWSRVAPYAVLVALDIALSNSAFIYLEATFVEMCKSSMPAVVLVLSILGGLETPTPFLLSLIVLICAGLAVSSVGEANFSVSGFVLVMIAVLMGSTKLVLSQLLLQRGVPAARAARSDANGLAYAAVAATGDEERDAGARANGAGGSSAAEATANSATSQLSSLQILYLQTPLSAAVLFVPAMLSVGLRLPRLSAAQYTQAYLVSTAVVVLLGATMALMLDLSNLIAVQVTSALSMTVAGVARTSLIIFASWMFFRNPITAMNLLGYVLCLFGVLMYNVYKFRRLRREVVLQSHRSRPMTTVPSPSAAAAATPPALPSSSAIVSHKVSLSSCEDGMLDLADAHIDAASSVVVHPAEDAELERKATLIRR